MLGHLRSLCPPHPNSELCKPFLNILHISMRKLSLKNRGGGIEQIREGFCLQLWHSLRRCEYSIKSGCTLGSKDGTRPTAILPPLSPGAPFWQQSKCLLALHSGFFRLVNHWPMPSINSGTPSSIWVGTEGIRMSVPPIPLPPPRVLSSNKRAVFSPPGGWLELGSYWPFIEGFGLCTLDGLTAE